MISKREYHFLFDFVFVIEDEHELHAAQPKFYLDSNLYS